MSKTLKPFAHLHVHTSYSLLDGAARLPDLMETALQNQMPAMAITDHGVMYGVINFYKAAKEKGVKPIIGCEIYITPGSRHDRGQLAEKSSNHLVLLAENDIGYKNLVRLVSTAHLEGFYYKPRIDFETLARYHEGLIGLSACLKGQIAESLVDGHQDQAVKLAGMYTDILGPQNFFLEIQDHGIPEQRKVNTLMQQLSRQTGLPLVATNDVHYVRKEHAEAHEILLCLQTQTVMSDPKRMRYPTHEFYLKTREEMDLLFADYPGAVDRTLEIADRCNVNITFGKLHFPVFKVDSHTTQKEYLIQLGHEGLRHHYGINDCKHPKTPEEKEIIQRFDHELAVIETTGFINYFLVVWDFVRFAHDNNIPVGPGRGSGGGSLVAYALNITAIDPLRYSLIFERFLNPDRISPPDFDIDFCPNRRGEVIEYVKQKYGRENVAQIITFTTLGPRTVIRDVGRVLEISYADCDRLSKMIPEDLDIDLDKALKNSPDLKKAYDTDPNARRILDYGKVLEGLSRNQGTHAAGVVIGEQPLTEIIPLARDKNNEPITQYEMEPLGEIGLLKMDFLGLKTLSDIQESLALIKETTKKELKLEDISFQDQPTLDLLNRGDTIGIFQVESPGMRDLLRRVGIGCIEDLIAMIALYRPGPMNMLDDYVNRKSGKSKIKYDHPLLEPILKETYGVMVYQEQVQKAANVLAGYSLGEADILRRAMGKKKAEVMNAQRAKFVEGCHAINHINATQAGAIFDRMAEFAGYGFNKAHSAGYAIISFHTAFLKANYPAEYMAAKLSNEIGNFDKLPGFAVEAQQMGLSLLPPDVNASDVRFKPQDRSIRFGLAGIKNVGEGASQYIVDERKKNGPYADLVDLCTRIDGLAVNKKVLESLARAGALDSLGSHRACLHANIDFAMARAAATQKDRRSGQGNLFDLLDEKPGGTNAASDLVRLPECPPWSAAELLAGEKELLGLYLTGHPLAQHAYLLKQYALAKIQDLPNIGEQTLTRVGGILATVTRRMTKKNEPFAILRLEDTESTMEVVVWPDTYQKFGMHLIQDAPVLICGNVQVKDNQITLVAREIYPLCDAPRHFARKVSIHVPVAQVDNGNIEKVKETLRLHPGNVAVMLALLFPSEQKVFIDISLQFRVFPDETLIREIEKILGENTVFVAVAQEPCLRPPQSRNWSRRQD